MEKDIAQIVINKYENSSKCRNGVKKGNASVNFSKIQKYNLDCNYKYRLEVNKVAVSLEKKGLIKIKWISKNNIIERIIFKLEDIDKFYKISGIEKKDTILNKVVETLETYKNNIQNANLKNILIDFQNEIEDKKKIPKIIEDDDKRKLILKCLVGIDETLTNNETIYERVFSKKYFNNSKIFEKKLRTSILSLIKKYFEETQDLDDDIILSSIGIVKTTNDLSIKGNIIFELKGNTIDLSNFIYGLSLNDKTIKEIKLLSFKFDKVISVENKANFNYLCDVEKNALIIFSGGFYSPCHKRFLRELYSNISEKEKSIEFYHWGDIDLGGINIYRHIKEYIFLNLKPLNMDVQTIKDNIDFCEKIEAETYMNKLIKLLNDKRILEMHEVINFIANNKLTLEQECLIINELREI